MSRRLSPLTSGSARGNAADKLADAWSAVLGATAPPPSALELAWAAVLAGSAGDGVSAGTRSLPVPVPMPAMPAMPATGPAVPLASPWLASFERSPSGQVLSVLVASDDPGTETWLLTPHRDGDGLLATVEIKPIGGEIEQ
jgi:hypothetical protein